MRWRIEYYQTARGDVPVKEFIDRLSPEGKVKLTGVIESLKEFGVMLGMPHVKKITGNELWELRTSGKYASRVLYVLRTGRTFVLLHGFLKKTNETPEKEIKQGLKRLADYKFRLTI